MEFKAGRKFPESSDLINFLERLGFQIYDAGSFNWKKAERDGPVKELYVGREYLVVTKPGRGQSPKESFVKTQGVGPAIWFEDPKDPRWLGLSKSTEQERIILFTRMVFYIDCLQIEIKPERGSREESDIVCINYKWVMDTFKRHFIVQSLEDVSRRGGVVVRDKFLSAK